MLSKDEIKAIDKNSGLSQRQFANQVRVIRQMIDYILNGKRKMTKKTDIRARESFTDSALNSTVYLKEWFLNHIFEVEKEVDKELAVFLLKHVHSNA